MRRVLILSDLHAGHRSGLTPPEKSDRNLRREGSEEGIDWIIYAAQLWLEES